MAQSKLRRAPDAAVATSVAQIIKQQKSKRMMMFGLRNLAELCSPGNVKYKENSAAALAENVVTALSASIEAYNDDEDVIMACVKILYGISMDLIENPNEFSVDKLKVDGGVKSAMILLKSAATFSDESIVTLSLSYLANLEKLGQKVDTLQFSGALIGSLKKTAKAATCAKIFTALNTMCNDRAVLTSIADKGAADKILEILTAYTPSDETVHMVEAGMSLLQKLAGAQKISINNTNEIIKTLDMYKNRKSVVDRGSAVLGSMLGPDELKKCLDALARSETGSNERQAALIMLSSMSYISAYADAVVAAGGIPLLCDAIKTSANDLLSGSKETQLMRGLNGAVKMLGKIANNPSNTEAVAAAGGLEALASALVPTKDMQALFAVICDAMVPLCRKEEGALFILEGGHLEILTETLKKNHKSHEVAGSVVGLLAVLLNHNQMSEPLFALETADILGTCLGEHLDDLTYQNECIYCVSKLIRHAKSFDDVKKAHSSVLHIMNKNGAASEQLASATLDLFERFLTIPDALKPLQGGESATAVLSLMLAHQSSPSISIAAVSLLESIATDQDVNRGLEGLGRAVQTAKTTPESAYKALAAVNGLSQVSRLKAIFEQRNADSTILAAINSWLEGAQFTEQQKIVKAAARCIESLKAGSSANMDPAVLQMLTISLLPSVKMLNEKQDPKDNNLLDLIKCCRNLLSIRQISHDKIPLLIEAIQKVMWKYPDLRRVQVECIDMMTELATLPGAPKLIMESGSIKNIVSYMQKVNIYEDVQISGLRLLAVCLKDDSSLVDSIKNCGGTELCKSIRVSQSQSAAVKPLLAEVAGALMPAEFMDVDVKKYIDAMVSAFEEQNLAALTTSTASLRAHLVTPEGNRAAVAQRVGIALQNASIFVSQQSPNNSGEAAAELSAVYDAVAESRSGAAHLNRCNAQGVLAKLMDVMTNPSVTDSSSNRHGIESNLHAQRNLLRVAKYKHGGEDVMFMKRQIAAFCMLADAYPDDRRIGAAICDALAAVPDAQLTGSPEFLATFSRLIKNLHSEDENQVMQASRACASLLDGASDDLLAHLAKEKGITALFECLDRFGENKVICNDVLAALEAAAAQRSLVSAVQAESGDAGVKHAVTVLCNTLKLCMDDGDAAVAIVKLLNGMTSKKDRELFASLGMTELAAELMGKHMDNKELLSALGVLLGKSGAEDLIESLIHQILTTVNTKPAEWQRQTEALCTKLAVLLPSNVENPEKTFKEARALCTALSQVLSSEKNDGALLASIALVARRLGDRFEMEPDSPYGSIIIGETIAPALASILVGDGKANQNRNFVMNSYHALATTALNPTTRQSVLQTTTKSKLIPTSIEALRRAQNDAEVSTPILTFLAAISDDAEGVNIILAGYSKVDGRSAEEQLVTEVLTVMRKFKNNGNLIAAGITLIGNISTQRTQLLAQTYFKELGTLAEETPQGMAAMINSLTKVVEAGQTDMVDSEILKVHERFKRIYENKSISPAQKIPMAIAMANLARVLADNGDMDGLRKLNAEDNLAIILEDYKDNPIVISAVLHALRSMADADGDLNSKLARLFPAILLTECAPTLTANPMLQTLLLELLYSLGCNEGNGRIIMNTPNFKELLTNIELGFSDLEVAEANEMRKLMDSVKTVVQQDTPLSLTLKEVYERWTARKGAGETLDLSESSIVLQQFDFVCDYTQEYSRALLNDIESEQGSEFRYGCLCFSLLHEYPSNTNYCLEKGEQDILLFALDIQKANVVAQCGVVTLKDFCSTAEGATAVANVSNCQNITTEIIRRGNKSEEVENGLDINKNDEIMIPRLELIERCAYNRQHYNNTNCIQELISVWDNYDNGKYSTSTLRGVFKAMRKIVNDTWVEPILKNQVPKRLIQVVEKVDQDLTLLPDVLFLLGALATVPEIKTLIGEQGGIEACLELIVRCQKDKSNNNCSAVITNGCLALANITIGHGPNISKFIAAKGVEINVEVLDSSMIDSLQYDVANAASVLMCNLCYRRDDIKELFGRKGGPRSVTESIRQYDGSDSKSAFRCLSSMLKAIGNLALYTKNIDTFLEEKVEKTFGHLYSNSEFLPDELLEVSLRTMSNLVLENTDEYMEKFGVVLLPLLNMLSITTRESVKMLALAFEVLGNLCRLPANAKTFAENDGINITLKLVNTYADARLSAAAIHVLGVQMTYPESIDKLIDAGVLAFLINLYQGQAAADERQPEVCIAGLRCLRRLLKTRSTAENFAAAGGPAAIIQLMQASPDMSLIHLDSYKNFMALLSLVPPPPPINTEKDTDWDANVPDEGVLSLIHRIERPSSPRSWESIGLDLDTVQKLVAGICAALLTDGHEKQKKLQKLGLGLLAYFACEKIPKAVEAFYAGQYHFVIKQALLNFPKDYDLIHCCCIILVNVSYVSELEDFKVVAKDRQLEKAIDHTVTAIPKKPPQIRDYCLLTYKLLMAKDRSPESFESLAEWEYDLEKTGWNQDPYPNGVQDLPIEVKNNLREGSRFKLIIDEKTRVPFWWKSSQDLTNLQWRLSDDKDSIFNHQIPVGRIRIISKGLASQILDSAAQKDRKIDSKNTLYVLGPPTEDSAGGVELNIKTKTKKEREAFHNLLIEWKDAATYGF